MVGELALDGGCAPSPESPQENRHERHTEGSSSSMVANGDVDELASARQRIAALEAELDQSRRVSEEWSLAASALVNVLLMSPKQNGHYAAEVSKLLESALGSLSFVERLRYVNCSFPAAAGNAPRVQLLRWESLEYSEWRMSFSPAWSCEVCVDGKQLISFSTLVKVLNAKIEGRLRLAFSPNLASLSLSFVDVPTADVDVECGVIIGQVPLPIRETVGNIIRDAARDWIKENLVYPKSIKLTLHDTTCDLTDDQVAQAKRVRRLPIT